MQHPDRLRRQFCLGLAGLAGTFATGLGAEEAITLQWDDLIPPGQDTQATLLQGIVPHDPADRPSSQPASSGVRTDWNGKIVRLAGFIIPLDFSGTGVTAFILVPYVGACIHVPPPPANQLVLVSTETPYERGELFHAVTVTGMFGTSATSTQLAEIGYALSAEKIEPYNG